MGVFIAPSFEKPAFYCSHKFPSRNCGLDNAGFPRVLVLVPCGYYGFFCTTLEIDVEAYEFAESIYPEYSKFVMGFEGMSDFSFTTWPRDVNAESAIITEPSAVFDGEPEILSCEVKDGLLDVALYQINERYDYSGGSLLFKVKTAYVRDEGGKNYSYEEFHALFEAYWERLRNKRGV